jgi:hypothetical protein
MGVIIDCGPASVVWIQSRKAGVAAVAVCGAMRRMCIDATVRAE